MPACIHCMHVCVRVRTCVRVCECVCMRACVCVDACLFSVVGDCSI